MGALLLAGTLSRYPTLSEKQLWKVGSRPQVMCESVGGREPQSPLALTAINSPAVPQLSGEDSLWSVPGRGGGTVLYVPGQAMASSH